MCLSGWTGVFVAECTPPGNGDSGDSGDSIESACGAIREGCHGVGQLAVGYWAPDIYKHINGMQEQARQRALLTEQILAGSIRANFWQGATDGPKCGCYKESNQMADRKCSACHGVGVVPGYLKFGYNTLWMGTTDTDITLTSVRLSSGFKSAKIELVAGALTGTIESGDKVFERTAVGSSWEVDFQAFTRDPTYTTSVVIEYSLDSGTTWSEICNLVSANPASGTIRFRATLTRSDAVALSPFFEIVRARYAAIDLSREGVTGEYRMGPWILVMREPPSTGYKKQEYGDIPFENGMEYWTAGLGLFDPRITLGSLQELIKGEYTFIEILDGARVGSRYVATEWKNSDPFAYIIVSQTFKIRVIDTVEPLSLVW